MALSSMLFCMVNVTIEYVGYRPRCTSRDSPR